MSSDAGQSQIINIGIGVIIGVVVTAFGVFLQFVLTDRKDRKKRKKIAYAQLKETVERMQVRSQLREHDGFIGGITDEEYDRLGKIMADNCDVLEESTTKAWNSREALTTDYHGIFHYKIDLGHFLYDITQNYEKLTGVKA